MQALGLSASIAMVVSFFLKWEAVVEGLGAIKINMFLGIENYAYFSLFGARLDFVPIVLTLVVLAGLLFAGAKWGRTAAFMAAWICAAVFAVDLLAFRAEANLHPGPGLWLFGAASLIAAVSATMLLVGRKAPKAPAAPKTGA
jgi:hypothetical protein